MLQKKEQGTIQQDQINEEEIGNLSEKELSNDSKDDPRSWK